MALSLIASDFNALALVASSLQRPSVSLVLVYLTNEGQRASPGQGDFEGHRGGGGGRRHSVSYRSYGGFEGSILYSSLQWLSKA